jgi:Archaeal enzymes of ATP-grasp superfamily
MIKSRSIPPVTVFVGGKMRSPFRIYSNEEGTIAVVQCEVPIDMDGLYDVTETLMEWVKTIKPKEFAIIDGVPVRDLPEERKPFLVASPDRIKELEYTKIAKAEAALITGIGGAILNESIFSKEKTIALITHVSTQFPDPNAVLAIVNSLNAIYGLKIETSLLEQSVNEIQSNIQRVTDEYMHLRDKDQNGAGLDSMYR